jgi:hypothetical protein
MEATRSVFELLLEFVLAMLDKYSTDFYDLEGVGPSDGIEDNRETLRAGVLTL